MKLKGKHTEVGVVSDYDEESEEVELHALTGDTISIDTDEETIEDDYFGEELTQTTVIRGNAEITVSFDETAEFANVSNANIIDDDGEYNFRNRGLEAVRILNYTDSDAEEPIAAVDAVGVEAEFGGIDFEEDGNVAGEIVYHVNDKLVLNPPEVVGE